MKATEQYVPVVLFIMLYKVVLTVNEILKWDYSNESYWAVLSYGAVYYALQGGSKFESVDEILKCDHSNESCWTVFLCWTECFVIVGVFFFQKNITKKLRFFAMLILGYVCHTDAGLRAITLWNDLA